MSITATIFLPPNGKKVEGPITNIYPEDEKYIKENNVRVSMEDIGTTFVVYFDYGKRVEGEPDEILVLSGNRSCQDTIKEGVELVKKAKSI